MPRPGLPGFGQPFWEGGKPCLAAQREGGGHYFTSKADPVPWIRNIVSLFLTLKRTILLNRESQKKMALLLEIPVTRSTCVRH